MNQDQLKAENEIVEENGHPIQAPVKKDKPFASNFFLQKMDAAYQYTVEQSYLGMLVLQNLRIVLANPALAQITGYSVPEILSFPVQQFLGVIHPDDQAAVTLYVDNFQKRWRQIEPLILRFYRKDKELRWAELQAVQSFYLRSPSTQITVRDITRQKKAEGELINVREQMEYRVLERTQMLTAANKAMLAEIRERERIEADLQKAHSELERRVQERTIQLAELNQTLEAEIAERVQAEEALKLSEALFRSLSENASDIVTIIEETGVLRYGSPSVYNLLGYKSEEFLEKNVFDYVHPEDRAQVISIFRKAVQAPENAYSAEFRFRHKDGSWRVLESIGVNMLHVPIISGLVVNSRDITKRKEMIEEKTRLYEKIQQQHEQLRSLAARRRQLARQVITAQEEERHRVSRELHDEAGQALTVLKLSLEELLAGLPRGDGKAIDSDALCEKLSSAVALCDSTMGQIRMLAHDLRPAGLDDLGLNLTLEGYCQDFSERTHIPIHYHGVEPPELSSASEISLYRFLQEGLTNVAKHAQAREVHVFLNYEGENVCLKIEDNGAGFDQVAEINAPHGHSKGIGLLGLQERLESLGGSIELNSIPGQGTRLLARLPLGEGG